MKTYKTTIPENSLTRQYLPADYSDAFACETVGIKTLSADEILIHLWTVMPAWVNALFKLRNLLVRPFGLSTGESADYSEKFAEIIHTGSGSNNMASVADKSGNETVLLLSDKHLDAYLSVSVAQADKLQTVTAITLVHYHNSLGKIYFFFVRPFHKAVVTSMLKSAIKRITNSH